MSGVHNLRLNCQRCEQRRFVSRRIPRLALGDGVDLILESGCEGRNQFRPKSAFGQLLQSAPDHRGERLRAQQLPRSRGFRRMVERGGQHRVEGGGNDGLSGGRDALRQQVEEFLPQTDRANGFHQNLNGRGHAEAFVRAAPQDRLAALAYGAAVTAQSLGGILRIATLPREPTAFRKAPALQPAR